MMIRDLKTRFFVRPQQLAVIAIMFAVTSTGVYSQAPEQSAANPPEGVGITEKLNGQIPLDLEFKDETGKIVRLGDYFDKSMPVIITPVFYRCQNLCTETLNGLTAAMKELQWSVGNDFQVVTFSINPEENYRLAQVKKTAYLGAYERESATDGWHFLTGDKASIKSLTDSMGFGFKYIERTSDFAHAASIIILTPDGHISRYLNTMMPETQTMDKALIEASAGNIGSRWDRVVLWCSTYDPAAGKYVIAARKVMALGAAATIIITFFGLGMLWRHELKVKKLKPVVGGVQA